MRRPYDCCQVKRPKATVWSLWAVFDSRVIGGRQNGEKKMAIDPFCKKGNGVVRSHFCSFGILLRTIKGLQTWRRGAWEGCC